MSGKWLKTFKEKKFWYWRKLNCPYWLVFNRLVQIWTPATCTQQARPKICFLCFDLYQIFDLNHFRRASNWVWFIFDWYCQSKYVWLILIYICIWTLKGWIYVLVYIMYLKGSGSWCNFVWQALSELLGGWRGEINESWTQLNMNLPLIPTRAVYIIIDSRVSGNCRPRLSEIKSWTTVINHDSPLKWSELSWIKPKQTGFFRPGHNNETFNWWVQSSNISPIEMFLRFGKWCSFPLQKRPSDGKWGISWPEDRP